MRKRTAITLMLALGLLVDTGSALGLSILTQDRALTLSVAVEPAADRRDALVTR